MTRYRRSRSSLLVRFFVALDTTLFVAGVVWAVAMVVQGLK